MIKLAMLLAAAVVMPAHAQTTKQDLANVVAMVSTHDRECAPIAEEIKDIIRKLTTYVDRGELLAAQLSVDNQIAKLGRTEWCSITSRAVANATAVLNAP